ISRRAFFSFLVGGAALVGLPMAYFERQIKFCDLDFAFRNCKLRGGWLVLKQTRYFDPLKEGASTVGWKTWINGEKYSQLITLNGIPTEEVAAELTEILQVTLDRFRLEFASRLA
ncbi:hypothetical protein LCGC14_2594410, partial [marine sediment metagenome]